MSAPLRPAPEAAAPAAARPTAAPRAELTPLAPGRYKVQFTVSGETHQLLREAQDLLRHRIPSGDIGRIFERALTRLVEELRRTRHAAVEKPRRPERTTARTRHAPASVKRAVWRRDGGRCAFVGTTGRCTEGGFIEYHHIVPFVDGGETTVENLELRCHAHNGYEAERWSGATEENMVREVQPVFG